LKPRKQRSKLDLIAPRGDPKVARMAGKRKRRVEPFPTFCRSFVILPGKSLM
jgi:hypothetical protein